MPQKERKPYRFSPLVPPTKKRNGKVRTFFESIRFPSTTCTVLRPFRFLSSHKWFFFFLYTTEYRRAQYFKRCCFVVFRPTPHAYGHFNGCCVVTMLVFLYLSTAAYRIWVIRPRWWERFYFVGDLLALYVNVCYRLCLCVCMFLLDFLFRTVSFLVLNYNCCISYLTFTC